MLHEEKCFSVTCDNCGELFSTYNDGWSLFHDKIQVKEMLDNEDCYYDGTDPDHKEKHYCPDCFKHHPEIDDKIIIDESRKKINHIKEQ